MSTINQQLPPDWQRLRIWQVMAATGMGRSTIWAKVKAGHFPPPHSLSKRVTVWNATEVKAWLESKMEGNAHGA